MSDSKDVRDFYNEYCHKALLRDLGRVNERQEAIKRLCDRFVRDRTRVLEIGCGTGVISRHLKRRAAKLVAVDISDTNIAAARAYAGGGNTEFFVMDIATGEPEGTFDAVLLADVIEHIPRKEHESVLRKLRDHMDTDGVMILSFPSPEYQQHLMDRHPEALQIVDEKVDPSELIAASGLKPIYLSYESIFGTNDYVHLVLARKAAFTTNAPSWKLTRRIIRRLQNIYRGATSFIFIRRIKAGKGGTCS